MSSLLPCVSHLPPNLHWSAPQTTYTTPSYSSTETVQGSLMTIDGGVKSIGVAAQKVLPKLTLLDREQSAGLQAVRS